VTKHNTYKRQTSMPTAGFEPTIPESERLQTLAVNPVATGIGAYLVYNFEILSSGIILRCVDWETVTDLSKDLKAFVFGVKQSKNSSRPGLADIEDEGATVLRSVAIYLPVDPPANPGRRKQ
jgi:hypothetical protein